MILRRLITAAAAFGWYLYRAARSINPPIVTRIGGVADLAMVFELALLTFGVAYVWDGVAQTFLN